MSFPTPHEVGHARFTGTGVDPATGNDLATWAPSQSVRVIAFSYSQEESAEGHTSRVVSSIEMATPPTLEVSVRDRFTLPMGLCEVTAIADASGGFHGWTPGRIVTLRRVTG